MKELLAEIQHRENGVVITSRSIDHSRIILREHEGNRGILICQGDSDLEGNKGRRTRALVLNKQNRAELQLSRNKAVLVRSV